MRAGPIPHYFNVFPTGRIPVPVCIGDLPLSDYVVAQDTLAEQVAAHLQTNMTAPGVIIMKNGRLSGIIPRHKMFERLGQRYGVELFLRKPIGELEKELGADAFILKSHLHINAAVKLALSRSQGNIYDPIIVEDEEGKVGLLDMYVLLLSQSQLLANLNGVISSLNHIETVLGDETPGMSVLKLILSSMELVVPFHDARVLVEKRPEFEALNGHEMVVIAEDRLDRNPVYRSVFSNAQPLSLEDVRIVPAWKYAHSSKETRSWMGLPLSNQFGTVGLLALSRFTLSPFSNNEKELAQVFSRYINSLLTSLLHRMEKNRIYQKII